MQFPEKTGRCLFHGYPGGGGKTIGIGRITVSDITKKPMICQYEHLGSGGFFISGNNTGAANDGKVMSDPVPAAPESLIPLRWLSGRA